MPDVMSAPTASAAAPKPPTTSTPTATAGLAKPVTTQKPPTTTPGLVKPATSTPKSILPPSVKQAAAKAPTPPKPVYSGPHINSIPKTAHALGATYQHNPQTGQHLVNGKPVPVTQVKHGEPHGPVSAVAHAAGVHPNNVHTTKTAVHIYAAPHPQVNPQYQQDVAKYGKYWADVLQHGAYRDPKFYGETIDQARIHEAQMYGIPISEVQVTPDGKVYVAPQYVRAWLEKQAQPNPIQQMEQQLAQPIQPFQWDEGAAMTDIFNAVNPTYQQMMQQQDAILNARMNQRGIFNSGVAQEAENQVNENILQKEIQDIDKQLQQRYNEAYKQWLDTQNLTMKQKQMLLDLNKALMPYILGPTPYQQEQLTMSMDKALLPYTLGPTPYQQQQLSLDYLKTLLPYQQMTAYQQAQIGLDQQKLQLQAAQYAVQDQQKWAEIMGVGPDGRPTLDAQKLQAQIAKDAQQAAIAAANASNNAVRNQITALHDQLVAAGNYISNLTAQGVKADDPRMQAAIANYNQINGMLMAIAESAGATSTDYGNVTGPLSDAQLTSIASQAARIAGVPQSWVGPLVKIAKHESGGNPRAVNKIGLDPTSGSIMARGGEHATGLMQTLPSTFNQYALPGHTNIYNPLDNMIAAIRYIKDRYGDPNVALKHSLAGGY